MLLHKICKDDKLAFHGTTIYSISGDTICIVLLILQKLCMS